MADKEEGQATAPRGADWEVVSLTASAYAAAPGGDMPEVKRGEKGDVVDTDQVESSNALFMSGHFVLPPNHHENNSSSEPENTEIHGEQVRQVDGSESVNDAKSDGNEEKNWNISKLTTEVDGFHGIPFSNEKSNVLAFSDADITENDTLSLGGKEQSIYCSSGLHSLHSEATIGTLNVDDETSTLDHESVQSSDPALVSSVTYLPENIKGDGHGGSGMPSAAWWKKQAASLYAHAKETNTFWSIFAAAAVMGILVIGRQERWQVLCHEWKSRIHDERMRMLAGPISRFKDAIVGGNRQDFSIRGSTSRER